MPLSTFPIIIVPIKWIHSDKDPIQIKMSSHLFNRFSFKKGRELYLELGKARISTIVQTGKIANNEIHLPEYIFQEFKLPIQTYKFQVLAQPEIQSLKLGPVIGLLTDSIDVQQESPHFRSIHLFCEELQQGVSEYGGFFYVFSYDQFLQKGFYFENGKWQAAELPAPDVIYNRVHSRQLEYKKAFRRFREEVEERLIPFFNDRFLSKWEVFEQLKREERLLPFLPDTTLFSKEHLFDFAQKYDTLFLKPIHGSQGRNIVKLKKEADSLFSFQTSLPSKPQQAEKYYPLEEVYQQLKPLIDRRIYIIQQGIPLLQHRTATTDFRVLCHRNPQHSWTVTSIVARIGAENEFVSNLARGGSMLKPLQALRKWMNQQKAVEVLTLMKELALETASVISQKADGMTGELGIDIGIDQETTPWLIEVNSKPSKNFEDSLGKIRPSAHAIIRFCSQVALEHDYKEI